MILLLQSNPELEEPGAWLGRLWIWLSDPFWPTRAPQGFYARHFCPHHPPQPWALAGIGPCLFGHDFTGKTVLGVGSPAQQDQRCALPLIWDSVLMSFKVLHGEVRGISLM